MKRLLYFISGLCLLGGMTACEERIENVHAGSKDQIVDVSLSVDFAPETDAYTLGTPTKANRVSKQGAFTAHLVPDMPTKTVGGSVPDALYNLEIRQYDENGDYVSSSGTIISGSTTIGQKITIPLSVKENCQLVLVAWGEGNSSPRLDTNSLSAVRKLTVTSSCLTASPSEAEINQMPYVLHVKNVKVVVDGSNSGKGIIQSIPGEDTDVRLRLKRLAAKLTINKPTYNVTINNEVYKLQQMQLQGIPTNFTILPDPDENGYYPSLLDQFKTIVLSGTDLDSDYSCWVPANVRGTNPAASSDEYRTKANAPDGSSFIQFVAVNQNDVKKKLNYRVYMGGNSSTDFNIRENTDYTFTVKFEHTDLPVNDGRVTIVDPIPASENNNNFVETANCFMIAPGGAFCFNPYKFYIDGKRVENTLLQSASWCNVTSGAITTPIKSVKVLWQTKENGDVGEPVLGVANSSDDHTNIVDLTNGTDLENARIFCRVAPNTAGGSGMIAAYSGENGAGDILWSWHIWVTEYNPDPTGDKTVYEPATKRKLKFAYSKTPRNSLPMMDRNLGAMAGFVDAVPQNPLEMSKANGLHYQWGRKDPFISSYSAEVIEQITNVLDATPPKGLLNRYGPDGIQYVVNKSLDISSKRELFKQPDTYSSNYFNSSWVGSTLWDDNNKKTYYDPCPKGWTVVGYADFYSIFGDGYSNYDNIIEKLESPNIANGSSIKKDGGVSAYFEKKGEGHTCYFRLTGYWERDNLFSYIGKKCNIWTRSWIRNNGGSNEAVAFIFNLNGNELSAYTLKSRRTSDAHSTRCIQERAD